MNFFLPSFFDYLQGQPALGILQHHSFFDFNAADSAADETGDASIYTMILTILLLLSTVEGVVIFCTSLYSWCITESNSLEEIRREQRRQRRRRRRFGSSDNNDNLGHPHLFWWLDVVYDDFDYYNHNADDYSSDSESDDSEEEDGYDSEDDEDDDVRFFQRSSRRLSRRDRIQLSLQEQTFCDTQFDASCAICLVDFAAEDKVVSGKANQCCRNCFHRDCLTQWLRLQKSCPCCRTNLLLRSRDLLLSSKHEVTSKVVQNPLTASSSFDDDLQELNSRQENMPQLTQAVAATTPTVSDWNAEAEFSVFDVWDQFWVWIF